jgi:YVTN family beta-propeller protein
MNYQSTRGGLTALACALPLSRRPRSPWGTGRSPRMSGLLAVATVAIGALIGSAQALAQNAYVTNGGDNTVSVIATATNTVTATIPVGAGPGGVAVSPDGNTVYVANGGDNTGIM